MNHMAKTIDDVIEKASEYLHLEKNIDLIKKAYVYANKMHEGQFRKSGEPYIQHPIEVAYMLAELRTGPSTISAGILHDVLEDTAMTKEEMTELFGKDVADIVDGVTKIGKLKYMTKAKALAKDHQKILLAMAKDIRVVMVKLLDRLHNMRTLEYQTEDKQKKVAKETLDLYAPLAHRLGMYRVKAELEDISLKFLEPDEYKEVFESVETRKGQKETDIGEIATRIEEILRDNHVSKFEIKGRIKNIFSIHKKMIQKGKNIEQIYDLLALRVLVPSVEDCYRVLGLVHGEWTPIPMRFKDYIALPKPNMYQSLHTTVVGNGGKIFEIQIRTYEMDEVAEIGIAAHWAYKEDNKNYSPEKEQLEIANKLKWYQDLSQYVEIDDDDSKDPLQGIIEDIFSANVYVFTPDGDVRDFPTGATPIDFAYRIHTEIGNKTVGAIVNNKIVPLSYKLQTGDVVEIKTNKNSSGPSNEWLKIAKTSHARHKIKTFLNKQQHDILVLRGKEEYDKMAKAGNFNVSEIDDKKVESIFSKNNINSLEELFYEIGKGNLSARAAINRLLGLNDAKFDDETLLKLYKEEEQIIKRKKAINDIGIIVDGLDKASVKLSNCCQPIMGDTIVGYVTKGAGIAIHRVECPNVSKSEHERFIEVYWDREFTKKIYDATIKVAAMDKRNLVAEMVNMLNTTKVTIASVSSNRTKTGENVAKFKLNVANIDELNHAIVNLRKIPEVYAIERVIK